MDGVCFSYLPSVTPRLRTLNCVDKNDALITSDTSKVQQWVLLPGSFQPWMVGVIHYVEPCLSPAVKQCRQRGAASELHLYTETHTHTDITVLQPQQLQRHTTSLTIIIMLNCLEASPRFQNYHQSWAE